MQKCAFRIRHRGNKKGIILYFCTVEECSDAHAAGGERPAPGTTPWKYAWKTWNSQKPQAGLRDPGAEKRFQIEHD